MDIEQRMQKLRNGSDTARWAVAEIDRLRNELRHANSTVDQMQEILDDYEDAHPAVKAERDEALAKLAAMESQEPVMEVFKNSSTGTGIDWAMTGEIPEGATHLYAKPAPADNPARITEQDALEIATKFFYWWHNQPGSNTMQGFGEWIEGDGRTLLNKLNADREQVPVVAVPENLRQWYIDLTNSDQVHDDGEISGYFCSTEMLSRLERIIGEYSDPSHSQKSED